MTPDHGTRARYLRGCHCDDCRTAHATYCKRYRYLAAVEPRRNGKRNKPTRPFRVDAGPIRAHVATLVASGMTLAEIQRESGTSNAHASKLMRGQVATVHRDIAARILAVDPLPDPATVVDEVAVERVLAGTAPLDTLTRAERSAARVEAARRGWTASEISRHLGTNGARARQLVEGMAS